MDVWRRLLALASLLAALLAATPAAAQSHAPILWHVDLRSGERQNLALGPALQLAPEHQSDLPLIYAGFHRWGSFTSLVFDAGRPVQSVHLEARARVPEGAVLRLDVRGSADGRRWQSWVEVVDGRASLDAPALFVQLQATLLGTAHSPVVERLVLRLTPAPRPQFQAMRQVVLAPTYTVFATRQGLVGRRTANGHTIQPRDRFVALPSFRNLSSRGGNEYLVRVTYGSRSVVLPVWDVGPWNVKDNYWSPAREQWSDLPIGMPMAQAAYFDGYNSGRDGWGRRIRQPNGIDIADGAFWDDLNMHQSDWVQVTFLWLGADPGPMTKAQPHPQVPDPQIAPGAAAVDDTGRDFGRSQAEWYPGECGLNSGHVWTYSTTDPKLATHQAQWNPVLPDPGFYEVQVYVPACLRQATTGARYRVIHDGGGTDVVVNQEQAVGTWVSLGVYHFGARPAALQLSDLAGDNTLAIAFDGAQWIPRGDTTAPQAAITAVEPREGGLLVRWDGSDDLVGIASFDVQVRQLPDGAWQEWLVNTGLREAWFVPADSAPLAFRARARDWAGNTQAWEGE